MSKKRLEELLNQVDQLPESERQTLLDRLMTPHSEVEFDVEGITRIMDELSRVRPIFHSEADFQHALAWQVHKIVPNCGVRLEYKPFPEELKYVDLWLSLSGLSVALELKYATRNLIHNEVGEAFSLKQHGGYDQRRYDFLKDIERLERVSRQKHVRGGLAILLTNDSTYWEERPLDGRVPYDIAFHLHEGRQICGKLAWSDQAGAGTTKGRESPIQLNQRYEFRWRKFGTVGNGKYSEFRYLLVHVNC